MYFHKAVLHSLHPLLADTILQLEDREQEARLSPDALQSAGIRCGRANR